MLRALVIIVSVIVSGHVLPAKAQGTSQVNLGSRLSFLVSRGVTANIFDLNADLRGAPANPLELRKGEIFPIEASKIVLAFLDNTVTYNGLKRTVLLTEDGLWGVAPLRSELGRDYFVDESVFTQILNAGPVQGEWGIVTSDIVLKAENITFSSGELVQILDKETDSPKFRFIKDNSASGTKFADVQKQAIPSQNITITNDVQIDVRFNKSQLENIKIILIGNLQSFLQMNRSDRGFWGTGAPEVFREWRKTVKMGVPFRITCSETIQTKDAKKASIKGSLDAKVSVDIPKLSVIGFKAEGGINASVEWSNEYIKTAELKNTSIDADSYLVASDQGGEKVILGNAVNCQTQKRYFVAIVPGIAEYAIDEKRMDDMIKSVGKPILAASGHITVSCFSVYQGILNYFTSQLGLDDTLSRFFASRLVRITTTDPRIFYKC
jgi:hypothetical protein